MHIRTSLFLLAMVPALASAAPLTIHDLDLTCNGGGSQLRIETTIGGCAQTGNPHRMHDVRLRVFRNGSLKQSFTYPAYHPKSGDPETIKRIRTVTNSGSNNYTVDLKHTFGSDETKTKRCTSSSSGNTTLSPKTGSGGSSGGNH